MQFLTINLKMSVLVLPRKVWITQNHVALQSASNNLLADIDKLIF